MADAPDNCPFCGGPAEIWRAQQDRTAWIACMGRCSVLVSKEYKTDAAAIAAWNTRATPPASVVEAMERALQMASVQMNGVVAPKGHGDETRQSISAALAALQAWRAGK